jgi:hypothetical protein
MAIFITTALKKRLMDTIWRKKDSDKNKKKKKKLLRTDVDILPLQVKIVEFRYYSRRI